MAEIYRQGLDPIRIENIYCIGRNYVDHINELGNEKPSEPVVFLKSTNSVRGCQPGAVMAYAEETFAHEAEIVLVVGSVRERGSQASWGDIAGIALGLDLTRRAAQTALKEKGLPWTRAKSFDGAAVLAESLPPQAFADLNNIEFRFEVNGEQRQLGQSKDMLWQPLAIVDHLALTNKLVPGDLIFTGTPAGVGPIAVGDRFRLSFMQPEISFDGQL